MIGECRRSRRVATATPCLSVMNQRTAVQIEPHLPIVVFGFIFVAKCVSFSIVLEVELIRFYLESSVVNDHDGLSPTCLAVCVTTRYM